jgi:hypothetical protein
LTGSIRAGTAKPFRKNRRDEPTMTTSFHAGNMAARDAARQPAAATGVGLVPVRLRSSSTDARAGARASQRIEPD